MDGGMLGAPGTLLLLSVVHADLEDGRPLVAQQGGRAGGGVQLVDAAAAVFVPEQEMFVVAQAKRVAQLVALVHGLVREKRKARQVDISGTTMFLSSFRKYRLTFVRLYAMLLNNNNI